MLKKVLEYAGEYKKYTYRAVISMFIGLIMSVVPFYLLFKIIKPLLVGEELTLQTGLLLAAGIALCVILHGVFYVHGLELSHVSAFNKNIKNSPSSIGSEMN